MTKARQFRAIFRENSDLAPEYIFGLLMHPFCRRIMFLRHDQSFRCRDAQCLLEPLRRVWTRARKMKPIKEITFGDYDLLAKLLGLNERPCIVRRNSAAERLR